MKTPTSYAATAEVTELNEYSFYYNEGLENKRTRAPFLGFYGKLYVLHPN